MKKNLSIVFIIIALLTLSYSAAALTSITMDRNVTSGTVLTDVDPNVAVKFTALGSYGTYGVVKSEADGQVSFDLSKVISATGGFNTDAQFYIGSNASPVFSITNNSTLSIKVTMASSTNMKLYDAATGAEASTTIAAGATGSFYFLLNTDTVDAGSSISGTLQIRKA